MGRLLGLVCGASFWLAGDVAVAQGYCRGELVARIDAIANLPALTQAHLGILVEHQDPIPTERQAILEHNTEKWFVPASTLKLLTTAAALHSLGPDFQIQTSVYAPQSEGPTHLTNLYVMGRGDPTFTDIQLKDLAQQIAQGNIHHIDHLWGYDGYFPGRAVHPNWEWEDVLAGYGASANGLILNENALGVTLHPTEVGQPLRVEWHNPTQADSWQIQNTSRTVAVGEPLTADVGRDWSQPILHVFGNLTIDAGPDPFALAITQPGTHFIQQFETSLTQAGITVGAASLTPTWPPDHSLSEIATIKSPPLSEWLPTINQNSNNLYAEALLKSLGQATGNQADVTQAGISAVKEILHGLGIASDSYQMVDGSGLSRHNLVTPRTLVDTLQAMANGPHGDLYRRSLAVAGEAGNLSYRFRDTPVQGRLQGKTGYVSNNESLAGYLQPLGHPPVVFSIFLNNANLSATEMREIVDEIILDISQLRNC
ncbi:D-alanyl-D-alanine carboxypeptidase/D-alanyl-D-alanine endopeptidase [Leptothoe sp. PORK10 BA2]|uniref:D-alanyl-D-alanine carboxypeptidase/D-alanyl-D-alanine endopeptidase n=1 Tax=Leptothoe sp. PORK10 BA2 TaxID=3110254 RepID=UPI002B202DB1|nr:D-alanyl-D-alanine carboxypeptidase/D-alanyl-D-alanine-endopeptidase [Leptothoe sp. PORK10 BA2]MEA5464489.1 D-alanyl-D-alanine carboxypeptidase/D-alanyl-D-alanine-endopeptidase [Leptothoe sp. PORK10 BA2]